MLNRIHVESYQSRMRFALSVISFRMVSSLISERAANLGLRSILLQS